MLKYVAWSSTLSLVLLMRVVGRTSTFLYSQVRKVIMRSTDCYFGVYDDLDLVTQSEGNTLGPPAASRQATMCLLFIYWQHRLWPPWTYCSKESTCWVSFRQPRNMFQNLFGTSHWSLAFSWITLIHILRFVQVHIKMTTVWPVGLLISVTSWPQWWSWGRDKCRCLLSPARIFAWLLLDLSSNNLDLIPDTVFQDHTTSLLRKYWMHLLK